MLICPQFGLSKRKSLGVSFFEVSWKHLCTKFGRGRRSRSQRTGISILKKSHNKNTRSKMNFSVSTKQKINKINKQNYSIHTRKEKT